MVKKDIIKIMNSDSREKLSGLTPEMLEVGELALITETDYERLYCKNINNEIVPIHRTADAGEIEIPKLLGIKELWIDTKLCEGEVSDIEAVVTCNPFLIDTFDESINTILKTPSDLYKLTDFNVNIDAADKDISKVKNVNINVEPVLDVKCFKGINITSNIENVTFDINFSGNSISDESFIYIRDNSNNISTINLEQIKDFSKFNGLFHIHTSNYNILLDIANPIMSICYMEDGANNNMVSIKNLVINKNSSYEQFIINGGYNNTIKLNNITIDENKLLKPLIVVNGGSNNTIEFSDASLQNIIFTKDNYLAEINGGAGSSLRIKATKNTIKTICNNSLYCPIRALYGTTNAQHPFIISDENSEDKIVDLYTILIKETDTVKVRCYPIFSSLYTYNNLYYKLSVADYTSDYTPVNLTPDVDFGLETIFGNGFNIEQIGVDNSPIDMTIEIFDESYNSLLKKTVNVSNDENKYFIQTV